MKSIVLRLVATILYCINCEHSAGRITAASVANIIIAYSSISTFVVEQASISSTVELGICHLVIFCQWRVTITILCIVYFVFLSVISVFDLSLSVSKGVRCRVFLKCELLNCVTHASCAA